MKIVGRRMLLSFLAILAVIQMVSYPQAGSAFFDRASGGEYTASFPVSLLLVEDEAFAHTAFQKIVFQDRLRTVGERAFGGMERLKSVWFPASLEFAADSVFSQSGIQKIYCVEGSYAQHWAERHHVQFETVDSWYTPPMDPFAMLGLQFCAIVLFSLWFHDEYRKIIHYIKSFTLNMRPQDRPELNPIDYRFP